MLGLLCYLIEDYVVNNNTTKSSLVPVGNAQSQDIVTDFESVVAIYGFQGNCQNHVDNLNEGYAGIYFLKYVLFYLY